MKLNTLYKTAGWTLTLVVIMYLLFIRTADAKTITWVPPTARADETPLSISEIQGYKLYYGPTVGNYPNVITINGGGTVSYNPDGVIPNGSHAVMKTVDTDGRLSVFSIDFVVQAEVALISAPATDLTVSLVSGSTYNASWIMPTGFVNGEVYPPNIFPNKCFLFVDSAWIKDVACATQPSTTFTLTPGTHLIQVEVEIKDDIANTVAVSDRASLTFDTNVTEPPLPPTEILVIPRPGYELKVYEAPVTP